MSLAALLGTAVWYDIRTGRIPNRLLAAGLVAGLLLSGLPQGLGWGSASLGLLAGLAAFLPFYGLRVLGAGDVKLLATVGLFVGYSEIWMVALFSALAGGVMALALAAYGGRLHSTMSETHQTLQYLIMQTRNGLPPSAPSRVAGSTQLPYALAIAIGTLAYAGWAAI